MNQVNQIINRTFFPLKQQINDHNAIFDQLTGRLESPDVCRLVMQYGGFQTYLNRVMSQIFAHNHWDKDNLTGREKKFFERFYSLITEIIIPPYYDFENFLFSDKKINEVIKGALASFPKVQAISIKSPEDDDGFMTLNLESPTLQVKACRLYSHILSKQSILELCIFSDVSLQILDLITNTAPELKTLKLNMQIEPHDVTLNDLKSISLYLARLPALTSLTMPLYGCHIEQIARTAPAIKFLDIVKGFDITSETFKVIGALPALTALKVNSCCEIIADDQFLRVANDRFFSTSSGHTTRWDHYRPNIITELSQCIQSPLEELSVNLGLSIEWEDKSLSENQVYDLFALEQFKHLQRFTILNKDFHKTQFYGNEDEQFAYIRSRIEIISLIFKIIPLIEELHLPHYLMSNEELEMIPGFGRLRVITFALRNLPGQDSKTVRLRQKYLEKQGRELEVRVNKIALL